MGIAQVTAGQTLTAADINQLPVVVSYLATGSGGSSSTSEVIVGTFTIPAGDPTSPGGYWWKILGTTTESGSPTLTLRLRLNSVSGTAVHGLAATDNTTGAPFAFDGWVGFEAIGASGTFGCLSDLWYTFNNATAQQSTFVTDAVAINTTIANTLVVTAQFSASAAGNLVTTKFGSLYRL